MTDKLRKWVFLPGSYLVAYLWIRTFLSVSPGHWMVTVFTAVFCLWAAASLPRRNGVDSEDWFWLCCTAVVGIALGIRRCRATEELAFLALHGFAAYWVLCRAGLTAEGRSGPFLPLDLLETFLLAPFGNFFFRIRKTASAVSGGVNRLRRDSSETGSLWKTLLVGLGVVIFAAPLLTIAANLLGQADPAFARLLENITSLVTFRLTGEIEECIMEVLFSLPVGAYLTGLVGRCIEADRPRFDENEVRQGLSQLRIAPVGALAAVVGAFLALYLLFFTVQAGHLLAAFRGRVPGVMTAAEYAREGFFQLCGCMAINFSLLFVVGGIGRRRLTESRLLRYLCAGLMAAGIFLAVTAGSKLALYISRFGFTPLRLLSMWWIGVLTAGCILALIALHRGTPVVRKWILFAAGSFALLCLY